MRLIIGTLLLAFTLGEAAAQEIKTTFNGIIHDDTAEPLPGATVMLLNPEDSTLVSFSTTNNSGEFTIKNTAAGEYLLNVNFLGMTPLFQPVTSGVDAEVNLGIIAMETANNVLGEVKVEADHVPIEITKDTISYNADAFKTQENAVVEDLLKKLPGIEVNPDGTIKAQGEDVRKVLVDGKEFFGDDPQMATKNLPANAVKKVKVYDKASDIAEFTGIDDGEREKTIDLQLRENFKKGLFGTAEAGYGSDERYRAKASINRFSKTSQVSFLGQMNNINQQGFSFSDQMNFSGGMRGMMGGGGRNREISITSSVPNGNNSGGLVRTGAGGLNFNFQQTKTFNLRSSYFYNGVRNDLVQESLRQTLFPNPFDTYESTAGRTKNNAHSLSMNSDLQIDSANQLQLRLRGGLSDGNSANDELLTNTSGSVLENQTESISEATSDRLSYDASVTFMHKFERPGRNMAMEGSISRNNSEQVSLLDAITEYFTTGETELLDQRRLTDNQTREWEAEWSYTEPLRKRRYLVLSYLYNRQNADYDQSVFDFENGTPIPNPTLSNEYTSLYHYHRPGVTLRYSGEVHNINAALNYQVSELTGQLTSEDSGLERNYRNLLPRFIWRWDIGNGKNMRFYYTTRVNPPSITQLSPVVDNSDPVRLYVGNPELDAEYNHNMSLNFHSFSQFSSTSFFISLNHNITENRIITSRTIDELFREVSSPINIDNEARTSMYTSFGRPLKFIHSRFNINANLTYTNTENVINAGLLDVNRWARTAGLTISNLNSDVLEYSFGTSWTFTDSYYPSNELFNQHTLRQNYYVDMTLTAWKKWKLEASYDYNLYSSDEFAEDQALPLMEFSLSRMILKGDKGQLKFSVFDALDENRGITRNADVNYLEEVRSNSIGRYFMMSFIYSIRGMGQEPPGSFRFMDRRRH